MFLLYNFLLTLFSPIWVPWMLWRTAKRAEKPNWRERTGELPLQGKDAPNRIWFHAVSVGEVVAAKPILFEIKRLLPDFEIVLSVTTSSGHQTARGLDPAPYDTLVYFPIDVARFQLIAMQRVRPKAVVIMETELWMNFLWAAKVFGAKTLLVNGRISDKHFPRTLKARFFYKALLERLDLALMQTDLDAERIRALGAERVEVLGSSKFDEAVGAIVGEMKDWRAELGLPGDAFGVVVGSTRGAAEERFVMDALARLWDDGIWVIHAPRHLESVPGLLEQAKGRFGDARLLSEGQPSRYIVVDSYGLLAQLYSAGDVAIIGGGFENLGGQNLIQPLAQGKPVLHGLHMQNFREPTAMADRAGASLCCASPEELAERLTDLRTNPELRAKMGRAAGELVRANLGAGRRYAEAVRDAIGGSKAIAK